MRTKHKLELEIDTLGSEASRWRLLAARHAREKADLAKQVTHLHKANESLTDALVDAEAHADLHAQREQALTQFLDNLLILEPALERFLVNDGSDSPGWDFQGAAIAAQHLTARNLTEEYAA